MKTRAVCAMAFVSVLLGVDQSVVAEPPEKGECSAEAVKLLSGQGVTVTELSPQM